MNQESLLEKVIELLKILKNINPSVLEQLDENPTLRKQRKDAREEVIKKTEYFDSILPTERNQTLDQSGNSRRNGPAGDGSLLTVKNVVTMKTPALGFRESNVRLNSYSSSNDSDDWKSEMEKEVPDSLNALKRAILESKYHKNCLEIYALEKQYGLPPSTRFTKRFTETDQNESIIANESSSVNLDETCVNNIFTL